MTAGPDATDIPRDGWVASLPGALRPYARLARLDRPIGTWLLLFPCWWGLALAGSLDLRLYLVFGLGAVLMRGAGCTLNDIADRELDRRVARTATRPLAAREISVLQAVGFMALLGALSLALLLSLDRVAIELGVAVLGLVAIYPFMKRITWWPQFFLGLAFNWGALMGWAAVRGMPGLPALLLYAGGIAWTLGYDTIYAHQDKTDDALVGIKSSARQLGDATKPWLVGFYMLTIILWTSAGLAAGFGWPLWLGLALTAGHFAWQVRTVALDRPDSCLAVFRANTTVGWLMLAGLIAGVLVT
ncbi:MAG TPA: 4-hydroxybenzoate octaprenyltransferase [Candidatus Sulfotelmatobacter sp.]|nr:4-hydroxybenzoate octaprenyltransferase [Candidatus Sulfotelmatobacter sp.]